MNITPLHTHCKWREKGSVRNSWKVTRIDSHLKTAKMNNGRNVVNNKDEEIDPNVNNNKKKNDSTSIQKLKTEKKLLINK